MENFSDPLRSFFLLFSFRSGLEGKGENQRERRGKEKNERYYFIFSPCSSLPSSVWGCGIAVGVSFIL